MQKKYLFFVFFVAQLTAPTLVNGMRRKLSATSGFYLTRDNYFTLIDADKDHTILDLITLLQKTEEKILEDKQKYKAIHFTEEKDYPLLPQAKLEKLFETTDFPTIRFEKLKNNGLTQ